MNQNNLKKMIDEKYISVQKHPTEDLYIYNYTQKAQFDKVWNEETLQCRGLIMDGGGNVVSRPFRKFFNYEELLDQDKQMPLEPFEVTEKLDGSLGVSYFINGQLTIATRGSFISDQAVRANEILARKYPRVELNPEWTYLFEIIYPQNRIVVDYKGMEDLILLATVHTKSGFENPVSEHHSPFPVVKRYDGIEDIGKLKDLAEDNKEGFVIRFLQSGMRVKVKFPEYVRLHRLVTGINARRIWDMMMNGESTKSLLERVPEEFYKWVMQTEDEIGRNYHQIHAQALSDFNNVKVDLQLNMLEQEKNKRKRFAELALKTKYPKLLFLLYDEKDEEANDLVWKMIKPSHEVPFKVEI